MKLEPVLMPLNEIVRMGAGLPRGIRRKGIEIKEA